MDTGRARWLIMCASMLALLSGPAMAIDATPAAGSAYAVYATTGNSTEIAGVDPETLASLPGTRQELGQEYTSLAVSADGSTSVVIDGQQGALDDWITVHDGVLGPVRRAIDVTEAVYNPMLSADGSRLVAQPTMTCSPSGCGPVTWHAYDTRTGEEIATIPVDLNEYVGSAMLSPDGTRLYVPYYESPPSSHPAMPASTGMHATGPWPLRIAVYDVDTGTELARREVPGVMAGSWPVESAADGYAMEGVGPAIALAPDGSTVAVVDAPMTTLTLLDARSLDVADTRAILEPASLTQRALAWLGIMPRDAAAKAVDGSWRSAIFSPDGASLYVTGYELDTGETAAELSGHGFGVTRIEVSSGEIAATALDGSEVRLVVPAPGGDDLYAVRTEKPWWEGGGGTSAEVLMRLDAVTLEVRADRRLDGWSQVFVVPARSA